MDTLASAARQTIMDGLKETARIHTQLAAEHVEPIVRAADLMAQAIQAGRKVIWFGNGGSATQSQHMAAEFVGRFNKERQALASIALTENIASITAIANDYQYELIFARQLEGLALPGDVVVGLSTSGSSPNVLAALRKARELGLSVIGLTGAAANNAMRTLCDVCIAIPSTETARIQEAHLTIGHILCALVEDAITSPRSS